MTVPAEFDDRGKLFRRRGRGIARRLKEIYPHVQILPLDYDPDMSMANIENRLQMLVMNALKSGGNEAEDR